ncbi:MAG: hypothetical protein R3F61_07655 [Myxococcota bacterium]
MRDDDPEDAADTGSGSGAKHSGFVPEPSQPPMDAPALERLKLEGQRVRNTSKPFASYVHNEEMDSGGTPFLRDTPFGDNTPGIFGGETPFFVQETRGFDFEMDDTEGIPTGLPNLLDLAPVATPAPEPRVIAPEPPPEPAVATVRVETVVETVVVHADEAAIEARIRDQQRIAFSVGVLVASVLWGLLLFLALRA